MSDFDDLDRRPVPRRAAAGGWFSTFTAVFCANVLALALFCLAARAYVNHRWEQAKEGARRDWEKVQKELQRIERENRPR